MHFALSGFAEILQIPVLQVMDSWVVSLGKLIKSCSFFQKPLPVCFLFFCRAANLILNLFNLMLDAGVPDIALEPDKTVQKV